MSAPPPPARPWWKDAIVYQIYPRSFADSDGDGIGDLNGITARLDYLVALGIDTIWLSPHFDSPGVDNGYDVRDYRAVLREFGTMAEFDAMLAAMQARGIRLIIDLVVNHSSDQHRWFVEAAADPASPTRDYYIWRTGEDGGPPNNWPAFFGGSAWTQAGPGGDYYLHLFAPEQPDLNWENAALRAEIYDIMRFWLDKGVSGFRMDVIPFISKDPAFADLPEAQRRHPEFVFSDGPRVHDYLREMRREVLAHYDTMTVGEAWGVTPERSRDFTDARRGELDMVFQFDVVNLGRDVWRAVPWSVPELKAALTRIDAAAGEHGWAANFLGNHDCPRLLSHFGDDRPQFRTAAAKALATLLLAQRGTPFLYQGDELGMANFPFETIGQYRDIAALNNWRDLVDTGRVAPATLLAGLARTSRDHSRTPMQWSAAPGAGFSSGTPWIAINPDHLEVNADAQARRRGLGASSLPPADRAPPRGPGAAARRHYRSRSGTSAGLCRAAPPRRRGAADPHQPVVGACKLAPARAPATR